MARALRAAARLMPRRTRRISSICLPMRMTGLSEVIGSWKTIATSVPQIARLSFSLAPTTSKPLRRTEP